MQEAETKGLEAAKNDAFGQITDQANRRGLFYSGIPIAEEQKYTGATFLPAVANLKSRYTTQRFNLMDSLAKITQDQYLKGQQIYQSEQDRDAAARAAAAGAAGGWTPSQATDKDTPEAPTVNTDPLQQAAYNDVYTRIYSQGMTDDALKSDYAATEKSARYGNARDKWKLQIYAQLRPDLFGTARFGSVNANNVSF